MKNIHLIATDKPSRLWVNNLLQGKLELSKEALLYNTSQDIYVTDDSQIKEGDWYYYFGHIINYEYDEHALTPNCKKIILTTDQDLIKDGVQAIDDEFLEWFVKNPSCEEVELEVDLSKHNGQFQTKYGYKIIIPSVENKQTVQEYEQQGLEKYSYELEPKQETLEEAAEKYAHNYFNMHETNNYKALKEGFIEGAKWMRDKITNTKREMKEYRKTATVKAKLFEKGDEDGMIHRDGILGAMEDAKYGLQPDLVPYISTLENQHHMGEFGKHYLCVGIKGEKWLVEKEIFESTYEPI